MLAKSWKVAEDTARNSIYEAYTRNWPGRREVRNFLKIETAP